MKKGQAAVEFLMTYGWAMLSVLVMIGALTYYGVLSPSAFLPERCEIVVGFTCADFAVTKDKVQLDLVNVMGEKVKIESIGIIDPETTAEACRFAQPRELGNGERSGSLSLTCTPQLEAGIKKNFKIKITYSKIIENQKFTHSLTGVLYARVGETTATTTPTGGIEMPSKPTTPGKGDVGMPTTPSLPT